MKIDRRPAPLRKSDLTPAFEAAKAAGYDQVSIVVETDDGKRVMITAGCGPNVAKADMSPLETWKASRAGG